MCLPSRINWPVIPNEPSLPIGNEMIGEDPVVVDGRWSTVCEAGVAEEVDDWGIKIR